MLKRLISAAALAIIAVGAQAEEKQMFTDPDMNAVGSGTRRVARRGRERTVTKR
jgi:hypothetical protein